MTRTGVIRRWNAERGFGFIRCVDSGVDVFFHVRDYRAGGAAPVEGIEVRYEEIHVGGKRPRAMAVQPLQATLPPSRREAAGRQRAPATRGATRAPAPRQFWIPLLALPSWAALFALGLWLHRVPWWLLGAAAALNCITLLAYALDKSAAERGRWRTAEATLHNLALAGGWPGAWLAQNALRHKSSKRSFQQVYALTVVLNCAALAGWIFWAAPRLAGTP